MNGEKTRQKCGKKSQNIEKPGVNHKKNLKKFKNVEKLEKTRQKYRKKQNFEKRAKTAKNIDKKSKIFSMGKKR